VAALLEVFHVAHTLVAGMGTHEHLVVRIVPRLIDRVEQWIGRALQRPGIPEEEDIFAQYIQPLLEQIRTDATQQVATLAENRLRIVEDVLESTARFVANPVSAALYADRITELAGRLADAAGRRGE